MNGTTKTPSSPWWACIDCGHTFRNLGGDIPEVKRCAGCKGDREERTRKLAWLSDRCIVPGCTETVGPHRTKCDGHAPAPMFTDLQTVTPHPYTKFDAALECTRGMSDEDAEAFMDGFRSAAEGDDK